jgi:hypothetical protein
MTRILVSIASLMLIACGGSLSDEQRKKFKEGMEQNKIVRVTDSEIVTEAHETGQAVFHALESVQFDESKIDSLENRFQVRIRWAVPGHANAYDLETQLIEAYVAGITTGTLQDNVQKIRRDTQPDTYDSLIYSRPVVSTLPDGVEKLEGVWNIYLSRKNLVLVLSKTRK